MKHINSLIICIIISMGIMQAQNYTCHGYSGGIVSLSGDSATINLCAEDYNPYTVGDDPHTMSVNLPSGRRYSITGRVELEQVQYLDYITLREEDAAGNTVSTLASYWGCTIDNIHLITKSTGCSLYYHTTRPSTLMNLLVDFIVLKQQNINLSCFYCL